MGLEWPPGRPGGRSPGRPVTCWSMTSPGAHDSQSEDESETGRLEASVTACSR